MLSEKKMNIGLTIGIPSVVQGKIGFESAIEKKDISVLSFEGEMIEPRPGEPNTIGRPIVGAIQGFTPWQIKRKQLSIGVRDGPTNGTHKGKPKLNQMVHGH